MRRTVPAISTVFLAALAIGTSASPQTLDPKAMGFMLANEQAKKILAEPLKLETYTWDPLYPPTIMAPVATHLCVVTGISGGLTGPSDMVRLYIDTGSTGGARFMLAGQIQSGRVDLKITASCAAKSQFVGAVPAQMLSEEVSGTGSRAGCAEQIVPTVPVIKQSAVFLAAAGGRFAGTGESVSVTHGLFGPATRISACSGPITTAVLAIGATPAAAPVYRNAAGRSINATDSTFVREMNHRRQKSGTEYLVSADEALCGLTRISGKFNGYGQKISLDPVDWGGKRWWRLAPEYDWGADATTAVVQASVRCYARDQRPVG